MRFGLLRVFSLALLLGATPLLAQTATDTGTTSNPVKKIGKEGVTAPVVLVQPEPEYSQEARKAKISGQVLVYLQVGTDGLPSNIRVVRGVGYGLDEKAVEAISQYKFKPATQDGVPVRVEMNVQVNFQLIVKKRLWPF